MNLFFFHSRNTMAQKTNRCSFGELLKISCHELHYTRSSRLKQLVDFGEDTQTVYLWQAGLLEHHGENMTVCLHHKQVLGNVFEWHATKCCGILTIHRPKTQRSKRITLDMTQQLKAKNLDIQPGHMLCRKHITLTKTSMQVPPTQKWRTLQWITLTRTLWMMQRMKCMKHQENVSIRVWKRLACLH